MRTEILCRLCRSSHRFSQAHSVYLINENFYCWVHIFACFSLQVLVLGNRYLSILQSFYAKLWSTLQSGILKQQKHSFFRCTDDVTVSNGSDVTWTPICGGFLQETKLHAVKIACPFSASKSSSGLWFELIFLG